VNGHFSVALSASCFSVDKQSVVPALLLLSSAMEQQALQRLQVLTHQLNLVSLTDVPAWEPRNCLGRTAVADLCWLILLQDNGGAGGLMRQVSVAGIIILMLMNASIFRWWPHAQLYSCRQAGCHAGQQQLTLAWYRVHAGLLCW
jgi:hypothetical protein